MKRPEWATAKVRMHLATCGTESMEMKLFFAVCTGGMMS